MPTYSIFNRESEKYYYFRSQEMPNISVPVDFNDRPFVSWRELYVSLPNSYEPESIGELPRGILLHPRALKEIAPSCTQEKDDTGWFWWGLGVAFKWYWDSFKLLPLSLPFVGGLML